MSEKIAKISILVNAFLACIKITVGFISHSTSILAEGVHSFMDVFSSAIGLLGIKASKKPADEKHPYGHYKFEVLSGVVITLILFITGLSIVYEAYRKFLIPEKIEVGYIAILVMLISTVVNGITSKVKIYYGKKENSVSLLADGFHDRTDIFTSLAVLIGIFLVKYWVYADSVLAFLVGLYIIKESFSIGKEAVDSLLDVSAGSEIEGNIKSIAEKENIKIDSLKTQRKGSIITANLEITLPSNLKVNEATKLSEDLRKKLVEKIENLTYIAIQIKSHQVETGFYKPSLGHSFGWQRKGRFKNEIKKASGKGPDGFCICPKCDYKVTHKSGIPCSTLKCPNCLISLERK